MHVKLGALEIQMVENRWAMKIPLWEGEQQSVMLDCLIWARKRKRRREQRSPKGQGEGTKMEGKRSWWRDLKRGRTATGPKWPDTLFTGVELVLFFCFSSLNCNCSECFHWKWLGSEPQKFIRHWNQKTQFFSCHKLRTKMGMSLFYRLGDKDAIWQKQVKKLNIS